METHTQLEFKHYHIGEVRKDSPTHKVGFENTCRVCLIQGDKTVSLQHALDVDVKVGHFISSVCVVPINDTDGLPQLICEYCFNNANNILQFINQCRNSNKYLQELHRQLTVKQEKYMNSLMEHDYAKCVAHSKEHVGKTSTNQTKNFYCGQCNILNNHHNLQKSFLNIKNKKYSKNAKQKKLNNVRDQHRNMLRECFVCNKCKCSFLSDMHLIAHMCQRHGRTLDDIGINEIKPSLEDSNLQQGNVKELKDIMRQQSIVRCYTCDECQPPCVFKLRAQFIDHHIKVHNQPYDSLTSEQLSPAYFDAKGNKLFDKIVQTTEKIWKCELLGCFSKYNTKSNLKKHYKQSHGMDIQLDGVLCPVKECGMSFSTKNKLIRHGVEVHRLVFTDNQSQKKQSKHLAKFKCEFCGKKLQSKSAISYHIKYKHQLIEASDQHSCPDCRKVFKSKQHLRSHVSLVHRKKIVQCPLCQENVDIAFMKKHFLKHEQNIKVPNFTCSSCGKEFVRKDSLETHLKMHQNIRDLICEVCSATFASKICLKQHLKIHNGEDRQRFACTMCDKKYNHKESLQRHCLVHAGKRDFVCLTCNKQFFSKRELHRHLRSHTKPVRFICNICCKTFSEKRNYQFHLMAHKNVRPYQCMVCERQFVTKHKMKQHISEVHNYKLIADGGLVERISIETLEKM